MPFSPVGRDTFAYMVLCACDATTLFDAIRATGNQGADPQLPTTPVPADPKFGYSYLTTERWTPVGQLRADDILITESGNCYFGAVLTCKTTFGPFQVGDVLVAIKGTSDPAEWVDDGASLFPTDGEAGELGDVALGFWRLYKTLTLADWADGSKTQGLIDALIGLTSAPRFNPAVNRLYIVGHSLGSALATYLTYDVVDRLDAEQAALVAPYFFASPKTGTTAMVQNYAKKVPFYNLVNYVNDLVPMLPFAIEGYSDLLNLGAHQNAIVLRPPEPSPTPPPNFLDVKSNHSAVLYAKFLDPTNSEAQRRPI